MTVILGVFYEKIIFLIKVAVQIFEGKESIKCMTLPLRVITFKSFLCVQICIFN